MVVRWEEKYYPGQVVANDKSGQYMAYSITTATKGCGVVRIINRKTSDRSGLWSLRWILNVIF